MILFIPIIVSANNYSDINIKFFSDKANETLCFNKFDKIPQQYWEGIKGVRIYPNIRIFRYGIGGLYYPGSRMIIIFGFECRLDTIIHELAHHRQNIMNESLYQMINHLGNFTKYEEEIENEM